MITEYPKNKCFVKLVAAVLLNLSSLLESLSIENVIKVCYDTQKLTQKKEGEKMTLSNQLSTLPKHLAIVLDGHRRFAEKTSCSLEKAYELGVSAIDSLVMFCLKRGITHLTLHIFSPQDLERAPQGIFAFLEVIRKALAKNLAIYEAMGVRIHTIGEGKNLEEALHRLAYPFCHELFDVLDKTTWQTRFKDKLTLTLGLNHSGREGILRAVNALHFRYGHCSGRFTLSDLDAGLGDFSMKGLELPPIGLFIFTGFEQGRPLPEIFFWQLVGSGARFYTTTTLWPDFGREELKRILADYSGVAAV